ncbi:MAG: transposase [Prevotella sp.]|jgi:REP element-mobilizing transposase RayT|nr:transposase [Prevotella sp.]
MNLIKDKDLPQRKTIRFYGYDYLQEGLYFVTICVKDKVCLFGNIDDDEMVLNEAGKMIKNQWLTLKKYFINIELHEYCIMPNHFHGIIQFTGNVQAFVGMPLVGTRRNMGNGQPQGIAPTTKNDKSLGDIIGAFKSITTNQYILGVKNYDWPSFRNKLWQRNYYEHIIRNDDSYQKITEYIHENPKYWQTDDYYI